MAFASKGVYLKYSAIDLILRLEHWEVVKTYPFNLSISLPKVTMDSGGGHL